MGRRHSRDDYFVCSVSIVLHAFGIGSAPDASPAALNCLGEDGEAERGGGAVPADVAQVVVGGGENPWGLMGSPLPRRAARHGLAWYARATVRRFGASPPPRGPDNGRWRQWRSSCGRGPRASRARRSF